MPATHVAALADAAVDGVDFDGLRVEETADGIDFAVPDASYRGLSDDEFRAAARQHKPYVEDWYFWHATAPQEPARWDFLRWLEEAGERGLAARRERLAEGEGMAREWGQLHAAVHTAESGRRVYELRHVDDADARVEALDAYTDPLAAREIGETDDRERYRPLKTAPTLRSGWAMVDLEPAALVRAVEEFYPATIVNWHREQEDQLDVTHWAAATDRQTGIYGVVKTWNRGEGHEHVEWVAEACCDDSQCLKRREWEYDAETPLETDGGAGVFPCREPCSLVISAARTWTRAEAEQPRTYEFELTPTEKEQVETVIDAVADGRADEIREGEFSEPANRWRTRFLRAKRFNDDDNLCGVPTEQEGTDG